jgi:hypothetical protein
LKWAGAVQYDGDISKGPIYGRRVVQLESSALDPNIGCQSLEFGRVAARENRPETGLQGEASDHST